MSALTASRCVSGAMWPAPSTMRRRASGKMQASSSQMRRVGSGERAPCTSSVGAATRRKSSVAAGSFSTAWKSSATLASRGAIASRFAAGTAPQLPGPLQ